MSKSLLLVVLCVVVASGGQLLLKAGMGQVGRISNAEMRDGAATIMKVGTNPLVITGLFLYVVGAAMWMIVLSRENLSFAYPLLGASYILVMLGSRMLFLDPITPLRWGGAVLVSFGVFLITRT